MVQFFGIRVLMTGLFFITLCHLAPVSAAETSEARQSEIVFKRMAVAPVLVGHREPNLNVALDDTLSCPIDQICTDDPTIAPEAGTMLMGMIQNAMLKRFGHHMVEMESVRAAYTDIRLDSARDTPRVMVQRLASSLSADLLLVTTLWRYRERETVDGFPERPASVAFALYLVDPGSGRRLWRGIFDASQEFATSDAAKFTQRLKMGLTWLSAKEMAGHGVKEALSDFPPKVIPAK